MSSEAMRIDDIIARLKEPQAIALLVRQRMERLARAGQAWRDVAEGEPPLPSGLGTGGAHNEATRDGTEVRSV